VAIRTVPGEGTVVEMHLPLATKIVGAVRQVAS